MSDVEFIPVPRDDLGAEVANVIERLFFDKSIPMPDGYTRVGVAVADDEVKLFITGEGLPAMQWDMPNGGGWKRIVVTSHHA